MFFSIKVNGPARDRGTAIYSISPPEFCACTQLLNTLLHEERRRTARQSTSSAGSARATKAFFPELGFELEGETTVEGLSVDRLIGVENVRATLVVMRTPDGHGRIELDKFHTPKAIRTGPVKASVNKLGIRRIMFSVDDIDDVVVRVFETAHGDIDQFINARGYADYASANVATYLALLGVSARRGCDAAAAFHIAPSTELHCHHRGE